MRFVKKSFAIVSLLAIAFIGCKKAGAPQISTDLSALGEYIAGYVPELIQSQDPVRIRFAKPVVSDSLVGSAVDQSWYTISPKTAGIAEWEDTYTFRFIPDEKFKPGGHYSLSLSLKKIFPDIDPEYHTANFIFNVSPIQLNVTLNPAGPSETDGIMQMVHGQILSNESIELNEIQRLVQLSYAGTNPPAQWSSTADGKKHTFICNDLKRHEEDETFTITWDGKSIDSPSKGSLFVMIPAIGDFRVTGVNTVQEGSREVQLSFSDHLDQNTSLKGMVMINGSDKGFETRISRHVLSVYPDDEITGEFTVLLDAGIRSGSGKTLGESESFKLTFDDINPQVELLGKGNIVPFSDEVILPFKAVNLSAVDIEVFEIFENNVMQFLQYSDLWYSNGYEAVGRIVGRHTIQLSELQTTVVRNQWQRYAIDLSHYTDLRPGSIYEVRIGFRKEYSMYTCSDESEETDATLVSEEHDGSLWQYYYGYDEYDYESRDNPCEREYYTAAHFDRRNILASNLGLSAKSEKDHALQVSVHDLRTTEAISGCKISVYDFQQQLIAEGKTNQTGICEIKGDREPAFVLADSKGERGYLKVLDANALSVSDFDVEGVASNDGIKGFIYCDRDVWRPGDTIFMNFILETEEGVATDHPVTCTVFNPRGQKRYEQTKKVRVGPIYSFPIATESSDLTGNWRAEMKVGGVKFNKTLKVETIKPNRLKITVDSEGPIEAWKKETVIPVSVQWLHGAPAVGLAATVELGLSPASTTFKGFSGYTFDDPARSVDATVNTIFDGNLDASGNARVVIPHDPDQLLPGKMTANIKTRAFEKGGDFSTDQFTAEWSSYQAYAGVAIKDNRWGYKQLEEGADNKIELVSLDENGKGLAGRELSIGIYQANWSWWWNDNRYELAQYNSAQHLGAFTQSKVTTNSEGKAEYVFKPSDYGLYLIRVCDTKSGHCTGDFAYSGYFYGDEEDGRNAIAKLTFSSDKTNYAAGDDVTLNIPSAPGSLVIVSIENDQEVLSTHEIKAQGEVTTFTFTATPEMAPNVYAHVRLVQPHNFGENDLPLRMYGVIPILIENPASRLTPVITMPDVLKPEGTFDISVSEQNKQGMAYTIAIVDEGLLDLTRFKTPDPWGHFYAKQSLGVQSWDVYDNVLGSLGGPVERILAIGGDGSGVQIQALNEVNRFKPVVMHLGPFILKPGAKATHKVTMPNYVGSVRAMVVAAAEHQYGSAEKAVPVKSPVMLLATMPRVLSPGEEIGIPVNVFAMDDKVRTVEVTIRGNEKIAIDGTNRKTVSFTKQGDQLVVFSADVAQKIGKGEIWIEAKAGNEKASQHIEIEVRNPNPYLSEVTEFALEKGKTWEGQIVDIGMEGTNEASLEVSLLFPANLDHRLEYLIRYPYGCLEQATSASFPQLYVERLLELSSEEKLKLQFNVRAGIARLSKYVNPAGGFSYWPGDRYINEWTNSYVGHFLIEAQRAGYFVDSKLIDHWKKFQSSRAQQFVRQDFDSDYLNQAYRLYTLALAGSPELGAMNRLRNAKDLSSTARYLLAAAYAHSGQATVAKELIANPPTIEEYKVSGYTYGSATRDRALIVEALVAAGAQEQALPIVKRIADELGSNSWYSTQTTAFALIALSSFASSAQDKELYFAYRAAGNEKQTVRQKKSVFQYKITEDKPNAVAVENLSESTIYLRLVQRGRPLEPATQSTQNHLTLKVSYQDMQGKAIDPGRLAQGTDFVMIVTVANPATYAGELDEVALQTLFPSGWEIVNQRLDNLGDRFENSDSDYQDIRDDRIYTFFDLYGRNMKSYQFGLNAAYPGKFLLPAVYCEGMYDHAVNATVAGRWVEVTTDNLKIAKAGVTTGD